ncbi:MAG: LysE family transporter [Gammaproteobacteria bacterium]|jgi:homoserine/homoserine lactone efflux protein
MEFSTWLSLVSAGFLISISPGPGALFTMSQSSQFGFKSTLTSIAGLQLGLACQIVLVLSGLGVLIVNFPGAFGVIKIIGMLYLIALGVIQWRRKAEQLNISTGTLMSAFSASASFVQGFFVDFTNIKGTVFLVAFLPLFVDLRAFSLLEGGIVVATLIAIDIIIMTAYSLMAHLSKSWLRDPKKILWQNRITGLALILIGLVMGLSG